MTDAVEVRTPGGRVALLHGLSAADELFLCERASDLMPAHWTTEALARCVVGLDGASPVTRENVRALTVGDREALLLHLRRLASGERLLCVLSCPWCGGKLDLELNMAALLLPPYPDRQSFYDVGGLRFRLPTGADQEAVAAMAREDAAGAVEVLLRRCLDTPAGSVSDEVRELVSARMAELDPQAELSLDAVCAGCGQRFAALFDTAAYLIEELTEDAAQIYREIHALAFHYHWSPSEILSMTARTRRRYLALLEQELSRGQT